MSSVAPAGADPVLATLVREFAEAEAALQRHVSGQVDAIVDEHGQSLLLRSAQLRLLSSEDEQRRQAQVQTAILDALPSHVALVDASGLITAVNASWAAFTAANPAHGTTFALGQDFLALCARDPEGDAGAARAVAAGLRRVLDGELPSFSLEYPFPTATAGNWFLTTITPLSGRPCPGAVIAHTGIAERKAAEVALQASEERFRSTFEQAAVGIAHVAVDGRFLRVNDRLCAIVGYHRDDLLQLTYASLSLPEDRARSETARLAMLKGERASFAMEKRYRRQDGSPVWIDLVTSLARPRSGEEPYFISVMEDITARKTAERRLQRLNRLYAVMSRIGETILRTHGPLQLYERACHIIVEEGLLDLALVAEPQSGPVASPLALCARAGDQLSSAALARDDGPLVHEAIGAVFRTGEFEMCNDLARDPRLDAWRSSVAVSGFQSSAAFPLKCGGVVVAALVLFADEVDYFKDDEIALMVAVSNNLSYALDAMHQEGQRHAAEESLRGSERRFRALIEHSADGISLVDAEGRALYLSPAAAAIEGRGAEAVLGDSRLVDNHPDEVAMIQDLLRELAANPGGSLPVLWRRRHAQGHWLWLEGVATNLLADPAVRAIVTNYRDVSARRRADLEMHQSQASLRMASRLGRIGAWALDLPTATLTWSDEVRAIHEVPPDFAPELARALDFYPVEFRASISAAVAACCSAGTPFDLETTIVTAKGSRLWIRAIGEAVRDAAGAVVRVQGAFQDISERRKLEQQFLRAQRLESIGTLAGGIAHDLNNVLTPIMLSISLLTMDERDQKRLRILATIDASAKRGADMVKQVLSFARGVEGQRLPVQVSQLLREVEKIANDTFLKNIQVRVVVPPGLWTVIGDSTQLHQLLLNLCVNARDAMPDGGTLTLSAANLRLEARTPDLHFEAEPGPHVEIRVEDSGTGMPPEVIERIFEPFFTTKEIGKGTGLGLSTSLAVVKSHHGSLRVYSEPGKGTTFRIRLKGICSAARWARSNATVGHDIPGAVDVPKGSHLRAFSVGRPAHRRAALVCGRSSMGPWRDILIDMCGRYELYLTESARANRYTYERWLDSLFDEAWVTSQTHDARPETLRPVVAAGTAPALERMRWGWHPTWMRAPLINARFETVPTKGTFKRAFAERRCIIPATGYFEWLRDEKDKPKAKYLFRGQGGSLLRMAGLWEDSTHKDVRERRFLVLTRAMVLHAHVHDRTPVLLSRAAAEVWLDPAAQEAELLDAASHLGDDHLALRSVTFDKTAGKTDGPHLSVPLDGPWPWESASL